jgi:hypothetical protein
VAVRSDAWWADLLDDPRADSVLVRSGALLGDPQDALPVLACWLVVHSAAPLAVHSDVSPGDPQGGRPDDCWAARLADDH